MLISMMLVTGAELDGQQPVEPRQMPRDAGLMMMPAAMLI